MEPNLTSAASVFKLELQSTRYQLQCEGTERSQMDGQLVPMLPKPYTLYHHQDGAGPVTTSTTKASIIIPEYCLFSGGDRQSASLIDIEWDAQNLGEMSHFYELVLRTSTPEAGAAYEATLQQALGHKRGSGGADYGLDHAHAPIFSRMLVDSDYKQPRQTKGGSPTLDRRSLAELGFNMARTICVDTAESHPVVWLGAPSTHIIHLPTINGQLWKYAWLVCAKALVAATADSNRIISSVPLLQDQLFHACSLAGRLVAAGMHDGVTTPLADESAKLHEVTPSPVHCSLATTPEPAPQTQHSTTAARREAGPVLGSAAEMASGRPVIQPNSNSNSTVPLSQAVYLRLCTLFNLPQLSTLSLQPQSMGPQGAAQQTCQAIAGLLVLSVESLSNISILWKAWQDTHQPKFILSCLADLAKATHFLVEATRVPGALQPTVPNPMSHWPHAAAVGCQKMLTTGLQLLMEVGLSAFYETFLSCNPLSVSRFKSHLTPACHNLSSIGTDLQVVLQAAGRGVDYIKAHAGSVELAWQEPKNGLARGSSAVAAAAEGAQPPTHLTMQLSEGAAAYVQNLHAQAVEAANATFTSSQVKPSPAPPQHVSTSTDPKGPFDPSSSGMSNGQHPQAPEQQASQAEGTTVVKAVTQRGPSPVSSAGRRKDAQGRGGAAAALQALVWTQQQSKQQQAILRILQQHQVDIAQHESFAPTLQEFALRQVRTACSKFDQLLRMWHAGVSSGQDMLQFLVQWGLACGLLWAAVHAVQQAMASAPGPASGSSDNDIVTACLHTQHGISCMEICSQAVLGRVAEALEVMQQQAATSYEITESCSGFSSIMATRAQCLQAGCAMCSYAVGKCMSLLPEVTAALPPQSSRAGGPASSSPTAAALGASSTEYAVPQAGVASSSAGCPARTTGALRCAGNPLALHTESWSVLVCDSVKWLGVLRSTVVTQQHADKDSNSDRSCKAGNSSDPNRLVNRPEPAAGTRGQQMKDAELEAEWMAWANDA